jgi:glycosyltransferase involved in cell wall biosynthesis
VALAAGWFKAWRVADKRRATMMHGHWVIPGGAIAAAAARDRPLVVSLHGSDVFLAEKNAVVRRAARRTFRRAGWVTACSDDLAQRAIGLGADRARVETVPYGVDITRFAPSAEQRMEVRRLLDVGESPLVFSAGRLVRKKGFEFLIDAVHALAPSYPALTLAIAGAGDLGDELAARAERGPARVLLLGNRAQDEIGRLSAAADVVVVPSVHDEAGNVDGLPNFALEAMATATPVVATRVGGLTSIIDHGRTGYLVPERDAVALSRAIRGLLSLGIAERRAMGLRARAIIASEYGWPRVAERLEAAYEHAQRAARG